MTDTCVKTCSRDNKPCNNNECRYWINYETDLNCSVIAADNHGPMTLDEVSKRIGLSLVRIKQIEEKALKKLTKKVDRELIYE